MENAEVGGEAIQAHEQPHVDQTAESNSNPPALA
jgi:hypothetical protein